MKTRLFLTISADGFLAKLDDDCPWSDDAWQSYYEFCNAVGNMIVGRRSYELMCEADDFDNLNLRKLVVVTGQKLDPARQDVTVASSPQAALSILEGAGFDEAVLGGGRTLNQSFFQEGLVNEIDLDVEPVLLGQGIPLIGELSKDIRLELVNTRKSGANTVRLHYKVI